ncbi:ATP-binding protein [Aquabacterium sp. A7-Y]|uniref:ATP-binding protein n=1 Tax=Aquabacterium sp. A7-Y TaxID=1349605 RepID=UPI00223D87F3|nr:ATP-binding protein [Aquabacterium sp. A7-Y]MCW7538724.1 ATP-binding protein [Aquabacterium sp. A7-Y]
MTSIRRHLLGWMLGALSAGAALLLVASYLVTLEELSEVFDENLKQVALAVASHHAFGHGYAPRTRAELPALPQRYELPPLPERYEREARFDYVTLAWRHDGQRLFASDPAVRVPLLRHDGLATVPVGPEHWRVYTLVLPQGIVQAAQPVGARHLLAVETTVTMLAPALLVIVLTAVLLVVALRRGLQPLQLAADRVAARSERSLEPIGRGDLPREVHPLIGAINGLMERLSQAFRSQRQFVADAAHELRTPLTALRLQLQLLERSRDEAARAAAVVQLRAGIERSQHLVEQLLQLSRVEPDAPTRPFEAVELDGLVRQVVGELSIKAEHQGIDLGAQTGDGVQVQGDRHQLHVLLANLVENAIRYCPPGSVVDVRAEHLPEGPALRVVDNGPGIVPAERERVFDRFYRGEGLQERVDVPGSGLGLAIVAAIAQRHQAQVSLHTSAGGRGLEARVVFAPARHLPKVAAGT